MLLLDKDCVHCNVTAMTLNAAIINISHYNVHNLYPAEAWEVYEMFMIAAFKVMDVTLQCTQSLSSRSMGSV
jgi:hypothetical protein